jgi:tetratricopeptide (TPR) repeat protein
MMFARFALAVLLTSLLVPPALAVEDTPEEILQGNRMLARGQYEEAIEYFQALLAKSPGDPVLLQRLAYGELQLGDFPRAESLARESLDSPDASRSVGYFLLGKALEGQDRRTHARDAYQDGAEAGYRTGDREGILGVLFCRFNRGLLAVFEGDDASATENFNEVLKLDKENAYARYELGLIAIRAGRDEEALALLRQALEDKSKWVPQEIWVYPVQRYVFFMENTKTRMAPLMIEAGEAAEVASSLEPIAIEVAARVRSKTTPTKRNPLEGQLDATYQEAGYWRGRALEALGHKAEARNAYKEWARLRVGDPALRDDAKTRTKALK